MAELNTKHIDRIKELQKAIEVARYHAEKLRESLDKLNYYNVNIPLIIEEIDKTND